MRSQTPFDDHADRYAALLNDPIRERFAPGAEFFVTRKIDVIRAFLAAHARRPETMAWLDVGCGQGELLRAGRNLFRSVHGCDVSAGMIRHASGIDVTLQTDPGRLPFADASMDLVTAVCVFHHVPAPERPALVREMIRVATPDGIVAIIEHNPFNPAVQIIIRRTPVDDDAVLLTPGLTRRLLRSAGLDVVETDFFLLFPQAMFDRFHRVERALSSLPLGGQYAAFATKRSAAGRASA